MIKICLIWIWFQVLLGVANGAASPGGAGLWRRFAEGFPLSQGPKGLLRRRRRRSSSFVGESVGAGVLTKHPL